MRAEGISKNDFVAEKYQILDSLGAGGMSNVWLARDVRLGKLWAIKEIKPNVEGTRGQAMRQALIDEANFMKTLDHPCIPRIVDIIDTGTTTFVVMDYVEGRSLSELMRAHGGPFDQRDVIAWGISLCDVLAYLHNHSPQIVYRDLKPANVMVRDDGSVRLIDFGIAWVREDGRANDGRMVGTPGYAPPEQIPQPLPWPQAGGIDPASVQDGRTDIYSLGTTLYSLVTGHVPHRVADEQGHPQVSFDLRPIRAWDARLSEGLERIILRATRPNQAERYQTIEEMRYDLEHFEELTERWRSARRHVISTFRTLVVATCTSALLGVLCLALAGAVRRSSFTDLMYEASLASRMELDDGPSEAERLYAEAIALEPTNIEPYAALVDVYESDYRLSVDEVERWSRVFGGARGIADDPAYAQLCFDVGTCFLSYYGIEMSGGSVGNVAIASVGQAAGWFERALAAADAGARLAEADRRTAQTYRVIASFYEQVTRTGKEGRAATDDYRAFWQALGELLAREIAAPDADRCPEGVRVRLCQVGVEALSSSTYLAGFARSGIEEDQAAAMLDKLGTCASELRDFAEAPEYAEVYGPVFAEIEEGLRMADQNVLNTYENPVVLGGATSAGEES